MQYAAVHLGGTGGIPLTHPPCKFTKPHTLCTQIRKHMGLPLIS